MCQEGKLGLAEWDQCSPVAVSWVYLAGCWVDKGKWPSSAHTKLFGAVRVGKNVLT